MKKSKKENKIEKTYDDENIKQKYQEKKYRW